MWRDADCSLSRCHEDVVLQQHLRHLLRIEVRSLGMWLETDDTRAFSLALWRNDRIAQALQTGDSIARQPQDALFYRRHAAVDTLEDAERGIQTNDRKFVGRAM